MNNELRLESSKKENIKQKKYGIASYYMAIAVDIILLYVLNNLRYMNVSLLTEDFTSCLWAINLSLSFGIMGNFILLLYRPRWFHHLVQAILSALALLAIYVVYKIFPFDLDNEAFRTGIRIFLIILMVGAGTGFLVEFIQFAINFIHREKAPPPTIPPVSVPPEPLQYPEISATPTSAGTLQPDSLPPSSVPPEQTSGTAQISAEQTAESASPPSEHPWNPEPPEAK